MDSERRWARIARWAFAAMAALDVVNFAVTAPDNTTALGVGDLVSFVGLTFDVLAAWWLYTVATIARNLRLPARRNAGWAFGFFVPIVNFWFPYQVARDCLPPGHPGRITVRWWWGLYVSTFTLSFAVSLVGEFADETSARILGIALSPIAIAAAAAAIGVVQQIEQAHRQLLAAHV